MKRKLIVAGTALALIFGAAILGSGMTATAQPYGGWGMMGGPGYGYGPGWTHGYRDSRSGYGPGWMHGYRHGWSGSERRDIYDFGRMHGSGYGRGYGPGWMHQW